MNKNTEFYKMQFEMFNMTDEMTMSNLEYSDEKMNQLLEQIDIEPKIALELGSGMGTDAIALNKKGVSVDAIEIVKELNQYALDLQNKVGGKVNFIIEDFFNYNPNRQYDLIYYMDGFGVSSHDYQVKILNNICQWLNIKGQCYIEVYNPLYWKETEGVSVQLSEDVDRLYGYNHDIDAFTDTWHSKKNNFTYTQVLHCYSLDQIKSMVSQTNLEVVKVYPGGAMNYESWEWHPKVSLEECLIYKVVLEKKE